MENQIVTELINYLKTVPDDRKISTRETVVALLGDDNYDDTYVTVNADFADDGTLLPRAITWEDGEKYAIDRIIDIRQASAMKADGQGERYTISVRGHQSYLFFERSTNLTGNNIGRWFVERRNVHERECRYQ